MQSCSIEAYRADMTGNNKAVTGERTPARVVYLVTRETPQAGFEYLTDRDTWHNEHDEGLSFSNEAQAQAVADKIEGASVLCSAKSVTGEGNAPRAQEKLTGKILPIALVIFIDGPRGLSKKIISHEVWGPALGYKLSDFSRAGWDYKS